jgi:hypothetical protein
VPRTIGQFVEQRTRWTRASFHVYARHVPLRSGFAGPRVWFWTIRRGFSWFSLPAGLIAPMFMLELVLTHPNYRQNVVTFLLLFALGGALPLAISLPLAVKHRCWRSILWTPTWFAFAFLRRLAALEAVISLPTRPFPGQMRRPSLEPEPTAEGSERRSGGHEKYTPAGALSLRRSPSPVTGEGSARGLARPQ